MDTIDKLLIVNEIKNLKSSYCRFIDTKAWDDYAGLFTEDAVMDVSVEVSAKPGTDEGIFKGRAEIVGIVQRAVETAETAHQVHTPEVTVYSPISASAIWPMQDRLVWAEGKSPMPPIQTLTGFGHYHEEYIQHEGRWFISSLRLTRLLREFDK